MNKVSISILFFVVSAFPAHAQFRGNNLMEFQLGNLPDVEPSDLSTLYNQSNLYYKYKKFNGYMRLEQFYSSDSASFDYFKPTLYHINYKGGNLQLTAGSIFETLGRGLLFRSYDIKNSILEDKIYRQRKGFYKDLQGVSVHYSKKWFAIKAIRGKALNNELPVNDEFNRTDLIEAVNPMFKIKGQKLGLIAMRHITDIDQKTYSSLFIEGNLPQNISYYGEYASALNTGGGIFNTELNETVYGAYLGLTYSYKGLGISFEIKDYNNMMLGTGFTSPPTLVKEHRYRVLNRSTHITELTNEKGYQFELYYFTQNGNQLTLNKTWAKNDFGTVFLFREYFVEYAHNSIDKLKMKFFGDYASDEFAFEPRRLSFGFYSDILFANSKLLGIESEFQHTERTLFESSQHYNAYLGLVFKPITKLTLSVQWEQTTDNLLADKPSTTEIENSRNYFAGLIHYKLNKNNTLQLFAGERRGGPACTSGVCYEILDFKGIEFRLNTKF